MEFSKHIGLIQWLRGCKTTSTVCVSILSQHESVVGGGSGKQLVILWFSYPNQEKSDTFHNSAAIGAIHQRFFETSNPDWLTYPQRLSTPWDWLAITITLLIVWTIHLWVIVLVCFELILPYQHLNIIRCISVARNLIIKPQAVKKNATTVGWRSRPAKEFSTSLSRRCRPPLIFTGWLHRSKRNEYERHPIN